MRLRTIHLLATGVLAGSVLSQAPTESTPLSGDQVNMLGGAANAASAVAGSMPSGVNKEIVESGIANFRKMLGANPSRVRNANGAEGVTGTAAATTNETLKNGKMINTSGVGVGGEHILLGDKVLDQSIIHIGGTIVHEGLRTKHNAEQTLPPVGQDDWKPPLPERRQEWYRDLCVYGADAEFWRAVAAIYEAQNDPEGARWAAGLARKRHAKAAENARNIGRSLQGEIE